MRKTQRRAIIVLGVHRSGTSALAGVLGLLGAKLPSRLMPSSDNNPKGHFEPLYISAIHDRILASAGMSWSDWGAIPEGYAEKNDVFVDELVEAVAEDYGAAGLFMVKDPRMCRLMPLWHRVFDRIDVKPYFAIPFRNPVEVARSLQRRHNLPLAHGCLLWLRYALDAECHTRGHPREFLRYRDLLDSPRSVIDRITADLDVAWPLQIESNFGAIENFLDPSLQTQVAQDEEINEMGDSSPWLRQAYECYEALVQSPTDRVVRRRLDSLRTAFGAADAAFTPVFVNQAKQHSTQLGALQEALAEQMTELTARARALAERDCELGGLRDALAGRDTQIGNLQRALSERDTQIGNLQGALAERDAHIGNLQSALAERDAHIGNLQSALADRNAQIGNVNDALRERDEQIIELHGRISAVYATRSWQITKPMRFVGRQLRRVRHLVRNLSAALAEGGGVLGTVSTARRMARHEGLIGLKRALLQIHSDMLTAGTISALVAEDHRRYSRWIRQYDTLNDNDRTKIREHIATMHETPLFSVVMPVYNPRPQFLDEAIRSVRDQLYVNWEFCIADDASTDPSIRQILERHAKDDTRIKVVFRKENGHISRATNSALQLASGDFIAFLDHDDVLREHALYWVATELEHNPDTDIVYTDSDKIDDFSVRRDPFFKPNFDIDRVLGQNMINHLSIYRRALVEKIGRMRIGFEGSQDYDLLLRAVAASDPKRIRHIPAILYHWRHATNATSFSGIDLNRCIRAARTAVAEFLVTAGVNAEVLPAPKAPHWQRIRYSCPYPEPLVSVIIPTRNHAALLRRVTDGVLNATNYRRLEVVIVDNDSDDVETVALLMRLAQDARVRVIHFPHPFNFSAINNFAAAQSSGELLVFLNNDTEIIHPGWLIEIVSQAVRPGIGAVGAKLYYPNGNIQHAGVVLGIGGVAGHLFCRARHNFQGRSGELVLAREMSAVTGACMAIQRSKFMEIGGFDESNLAVAFNDIDFCIRLRERGYRNIWTPFAELYHHESASRGSDIEPEAHPRFIRECAYMRGKWSKTLLNDPFYNPNLSLDSVNAELASPPRLTRPWDVRSYTLVRALPIQPESCEDIRSSDDKAPSAEL